MHSVYMQQMMDTVLITITAGLQTARSPDSSSSGAWWEPATCHEHWHPHPHPHSIGGRADKQSRLKKIQRNTIYFHNSIITYLHCVT